MAEIIRGEGHIDPTIRYFTCPVSESVRVGDACRLQPDGTIRKIRQGEGGPRLWDAIHDGDFWAVRDADIGAVGEFIKVG